MMDCLYGFLATGGASWSAANNGLSSTDVLDVAIQSGSPATLYARINGGGIFKKAPTR
jgi:hypothetical protein